VFENTYILALQQSDAVRSLQYIGVKHVAVRTQDFLTIIIRQKMLMIDTTFKVDCNHITAVVVENNGEQGLINA
jgi:hypothetical protein